MSNDQTPGGPPGDDRLSTWCGLVLAGAFLLTPFLGWGGCLAFAPLVAAGGLLTTPALRWRRDLLPVLLPAASLLIWMFVTASWSPFHPRTVATFEAPKVAILAICGWSLTMAAGRAGPAARLTALRAFVWGMAALGALMTYEALTAASVYIAFRHALGNPVRPDLGVKAIARGLSVLALLGPAAALACLRITGWRWPAWCMVAGLVIGSIAFGYDAPLLAMVVSIVLGLAAHRFPTLVPRVFAALAAIYFLGAPWLVDLARALGVYQAMEARVSLSWAQRMGYWRHAVDLTQRRPILGWGLDASRMFTPDIRLHPHDGALQIWLELGLVGAILAAGLCAALILRSTRDTSADDTAARVATAAAYLTIGAVSFGVWQEWWVALGGLACAACSLVRPRTPDEAEGTGVERLGQTAV